MSVQSKPGEGHAPTPRTNTAIYNGYDYLTKEARAMEREIDVLKQRNEALVALAEHVLGMADDAYLVGHPEWTDAIVPEASAALSAHRQHEGSQ